MKIATVVGARPQFIKAAILSIQLRERHDEFLIHTGQHFDPNMSDIFFEELELQRPRYNLGISGGTHGSMTGAMLTGIEKILLEEQPDALLLYGDTNSTLAGALAAVKLHIPIFHIEAGNRLGTLDNPEEANRIATDHLSTLLFCASDSAMHFLKQEGLGARAYLSGNVMFDAFQYFSEKAEACNARPVDDGGNPVALPEEYCYLTCHRAENTSDDAPLLEIFKAAEALPFPTFYPVHPRSRERARRLMKQWGFRKMNLLPPTGYLESIRLTRNAKLIITDSGGLQCEAFYAGVPCITVFEHVVWPETLKNNCNQMAHPDAADITAKIAVKPVFDAAYQPFGDGHACKKILERINIFEEGK